MKPAFILARIILIVIVLANMFCVRAAVAPRQQANVQAQASMLREAYLLMAKANHDHQRHRAEAMRHTAEAANLLGTHLTGDGKGAELQSRSDAQIREAQRILRRVKAHRSGPHHRAVRKHANAAIHELSFALGKG
jgi:hypothetical protein